MSKTMVSVLFTALTWFVTIFLITSSVPFANADECSPESCRISNEDFAVFSGLCDECSANFPDEFNSLCREKCFSTGYFGGCAELIYPGQRAVYENMVKDAAVQ